MTARRTDPFGVLLVAADRAVVRAIREAFDDVDVEVSIRVATDGDDALASLTDDGSGSSVPDLVLLDPSGTDGYDLLEALADDPALARRPVLVLAESPTGADVRRGYELAANATLRKPTDAEEYTDLVAAIADFWLRRAELPPA